MRELLNDILKAFSYSKDSSTLTLEAKTNRQSSQPSGTSRSTSIFAYLNSKQTKGGSTTSCISHLKEEITNNFLLIRKVSIQSSAVLSSLLQRLWKGCAMVCRTLDVAFSIKRKQGPLLLP